MFLKRPTRISLKTTAPLVMFFAVFMLVGVGLGMFRSAFQFLLLFVGGVLFLVVSKILKIPPFH